MVHVSAVRREFAAARFSEGGGDVDQIDQTLSGTKLYKSEFFQVTFYGTAEHIAIKRDRSFHVGNAEYDVVEALGLDDVQAAVLRYPSRAWAEW
jgi:hypothetical protein